MLKHIEQFGGIAPEISARLTKDSVALMAENVDLSSGKIVPVHARKSDTLPSDSDKSGSWHWLNTDYVRSAINNDRMDRTYYVALTGTNKGHLKHKGTINNTTFDVEVKNTKPSAAPSCAVTPIFTAGSTSSGQFCIGSFVAGWGPRYAQYGRKTSGTEDFGNPREHCSISSVVQDGNTLKITAHYPGSYLTGSSSDGGGMALPQRRGTLFLKKATGSNSYSSANSTYFNFESAYTPSYITIYRADGAPYARLHVSGVEITNVEGDYGTSSKPLHPASESVRYRYFPGDLVITCSIEYADASSYRYYLWTYTDQYGQESPNSDISSIASCRYGDTVAITLTGIPKTARKVNLYRTSGSVAQNSASFYYCKEFDVANGPGSDASWTKTDAGTTYTIVFTDTVSDEE